MTQNAGTKTDIPGVTEKHTIRKPQSLVRGKPYIVEQFSQHTSIYVDKRTNKTPVKLIAIYKDFKMPFYTYLPKDYDDKEAAYCLSLNNKIKNGKNIRIVFYGCIGSKNELVILDHDEEVDQEKLQGIRLLEATERNAAESPEPSPKKVKLDD